MSERMNKVVNIDLSVQPQLLALDSPEIREAAEGWLKAKEQARHANFNLANRRDRLLGLLAKRELAKHGVVVHRKETTTTNWKSAFNKLVADTGADGNQLCLAFSNTNTTASIKEG